MRSVVDAGIRRKDRVLRGSATAALLACLALAAACGGGEAPARTVASVAPKAGTTASPAAGASTGDPLAFAACMRANGMPDFPDPQPGKGPALSPELVDSPQFKTAEKSCKQYQPSAPAKQPAPDDSWPISDKLKYAKCMRDNGVPSFPDPDDNGGFIFPQNGTVDPASEPFKKAEQTCKQYQPQNMPKKGQMKGGDTP
ncbi:hypothetical protein HCN51_47860 [Nonomuraea sp. FMUSA5-5]|uniref:Lipoprotein n=1 Tax=Nonomuraea composti TaxID=2720023 RepID=A0ABX1BH69_9ACTN|nr:hypothetical protein [Nonomuraea sp. FMUSA5-5]NJP97061.1 hypothetical protein [Nonomuraea sp. FMUSA5-5]